MKNQKVEMKLHPNLEQHFRRYQKDHYNFVTPDIEELHKHYNIIVEVSSGSPFLGQAVRGVSVYYFDQPNRRFINIGNEDRMGIAKSFSGQPWQDVDREAKAYGYEALKLAVSRYEEIAEWL